MKYFKRAHNNVAASTITIKNEVEMDDKEEKDEISVETAHHLINKCLELFDCFPLKNIKLDRMLQTGKRKISKVTSAFSKAVAMTLNEPTLGQSTDCLNCCRLVEMIKKKLAITEDKGKIIQLKTIVPCDLSISKVAEVFGVSECTARQTHELRLQKESFQCQNKKEGLASLKRSNKLFLHFMRVKKSVAYSQGRKIVLVFDFQIKQRWRKTKTGKLTFQCLHS